MLDTFNDLLWSQAPLVALIGLGALFWLLLAALLLLFTPGRRALRRHGRRFAAAVASRPNAAERIPANALQHR